MRFTLDPYIISAMDEAMISSFLTSSTLKAILKDAIADREIQKCIQKIDKNLSDAEGTHFIDYQHATYLISRYLVDNPIRLPYDLPSNTVFSIRQALIYCYQNLLIKDRRKATLVSERLSMEQPVNYDKNSEPINYIYYYYLFMNSMIVYPNKKEIPIVSTYDVNNYLKTLVQLSHNAKEKNIIQAVVKSLDSIVVEHFDLIESYFQSNSCKSVQENIYNVYQNSPIYQKVLYSQNQEIKNTLTKKQQFFKI